MQSMFQTMVLPKTTGSPSWSYALGALTIKNFCREYGIGPTCTYKLISEGKLRACKAGKRTLITRASAEAWLASLSSLAPGAAAYGKTARRRSSLPSRAGQGAAA